MYEFASKFDMFVLNKKVEADRLKQNKPLWLPHKNY